MQPAKPPRHRATAQTFCLALLLLFTGASPALAQSDAETDYAPSSCAAAKLVSHPEFGRDGAFVYYSFVAPHPKLDAASVLQRLNETNLDGGAYYDARGQDGTRIYFEMNHYRSTSERIDFLFAELCRSLTPLGFDIEHARLRPWKEGVARARQRAEDMRKYFRIFGLEDAERGIDKLLRDDWTALQSNFFNVPTQFARVREYDVHCTYVASRLGPFEDHFSCEIGVLATSARGPEYQKETLEIVRSESVETDGSHKLRLYEYPLVPPIG